MVVFEYAGQRRYAKELGPANEHGNIPCQQYLPERGFRTFKPGRRFNVQKVGFANSCLVKVRSLFS